MGKLGNLLKWKKAIYIKNDKGLSAKDEEGNPVIVYMRIVGDHDLEEAGRKARFASAKRRATLLDPESEEHTINVEIFNEATKEQCIEVITQGNGTQWSSEAFSEVVIPELPKIDDVARNPDAPTLEELEQLDKKVEEVNEGYQKEIAEYIQSRQEVLRAELESKSEEELRELAKNNIIIILSVESYINTLLDEKVWRSVYQDEDYRLREFNSIDEFLNSSTGIIAQLREAYQELEAGLDDIKN